jgi:hypothetical protein
MPLEGSMIEARQPVPFVVEPVLEFHGSGQQKARA